MGYVFISYSSKDCSLADSINQHLKKDHIATWIAPDSIPAGKTYQEEINHPRRNTCNKYL